MPTLDANALSTLLEPYVQDELVAAGLYSRLSLYLDLLLKWNAKTNLTAIRDPEEIVRRHFGESLFTGIHLPHATTLLDFGSGAGFPGLPIQLLRPELAVTLAESQNKKASFLREAVRTLELPTEVWGSRVEAMPADQQFEIVTLRAVDNMQAAISAAIPRASNYLVVLTTARHPLPVAPGFVLVDTTLMPLASEKQIVLLRRNS